MRTLPKEVCKIRYDILISRGLSTSERLPFQDKDPIGFADGRLNLKTIENHY